MTDLCTHPNRYDGYCIHCWAERARQAERKARQYEIDNPTICYQCGQAAEQGWVSPVQEAENKKEYFRLCDVRDDLLKKLTISVEALHKARHAMRWYLWHECSDHDAMEYRVIQAVESALAAIEKNHSPDCDVNDTNPDGIKKPCNCP